MKELVISVYQENIDWINSINAVEKITIYNKGNRNIPDSIILPNVGREAHTFLYHIISRYDSLADFTIFLQGDPFYGHMQGVNALNFNQKLTEHNFDRNIHEPAFWPSNGLIHDGTGFSKACYTQYIEGEPPEIYFSPGAQWIVPKYNILTKNINFYKKILEDVSFVSVNNQHGVTNPWTLEGLWNYIFDRNTRSKIL